MTILSRASYVITPKAYKAGKLYAAKPIIEPGDAGYPVSIGDLSVSRASTKLRRNSSGVIESIANDVPAIHFPFGGACPYILCEPQTTNYALYSQDFTNGAWNKGTCSITANAAAAPDGTNNAQLLTEGVGSVLSRFSQSTSLTGSLKVFSIVAKYKTGGRAWLKIDNGPTCWFNIQTGVVGTVGSGCQTFIEDYGNGWYRCTVYNPASVTGAIYYGSADANGADSYTGDGRDAFYVWQADATNAFSLPIPTTNAAVTRSADSINKNGISTLIGQTEGTILINFTPKTLEDSYILNLSDGSFNNRILFFFSAGKIQCVATVAGVNVFNKLTAATFGINDNITIKMAYKASDFVFDVNGVKLTQASGTVPAMDQINLGERSDNSYTINARYSVVALWKERLTNTEMDSIVLS